jgi:two-component system, sensor histidine kinase and response regulator
MTNSDYHSLKAVITATILQPCSGTGQVQQTTLPSDSKSIFDQHVFLATWRNDAEFIEELCKLFISQYPPLLTGLREASHKGDATGLRFIAHQLRGTVGNFSAERATTLLRRIEELANDPEPQGTESLCTQLESELDHLRAALERMMLTL